MPECALRIRRPIAIIRLISWLVLALALLPVTLYGQSVWAKGGVSSLMSASGFQIDYRTSPAQGWFGAGFGDGFQVGGYLQTRYRDFGVGLGDRYQALTLDTDVLDSSRYFSGRGLFVNRPGDDQSWSAFVGATADERSYSFFRSFDMRQPTGAFFMERKLNFAQASFHSVNIIQDKTTSLQSIKFTVRKNWTTNAGAGVGSNSGFFSAGTQYEGGRLELLASFSQMGDSFERIGGVRSNAPEHVGANVRVRYMLSRHFSFAGGHENFFSPASGIGPSARVSLNSAGIYSSIKGFQVSSTASTSASGAIRTNTQNYMVSRSITRGISAMGSVMSLQSGFGKSIVISGSVQERFSPRLTLNQGVVTQHGMTTSTFGGRFVSNLLTIGLQHDLLYTPLAGGFRGKTYTHVYSVSLNFRVFRGIRLHTDSYVDPTGRVRYTGWADGVGWSRDGEGNSRGPNTTVPAFGKFVVKGVVQDEKGEPIWGVFVQVDGQSAYTDSKGQFFLRFRQGLQYPVAILPDRALNPQTYEIVSAPVSALAQPETDATPIIIVLRRTGGIQQLPKKRSEFDPPQPGTETVSGDDAATRPAATHSAASLVHNVQ